MNQEDLRPLKINQAKKKRLMVIAAGLVFLALAATLALTALEDNIVFFRSPSDIVATPARAGRGDKDWRAGAEWQRHARRAGRAICCHRFGA